MLVKCRACQNKIDRDKAFKVIIKGKNHYYCNENEYNEINKRKYYKDQIYEYIIKIFGYKVTNTALFKELSGICEIYSYKVVYYYLYDNINDLCTVMSRDFVHEYARIRYFAAILKNNLADYRDTEYKAKTFAPPVKYTQEVVGQKFKAGKPRRGLADIESEVG